LGDSEKALKHFKSAHDLDATNHQVLTGMADLLYQQGDWEKCFKLYQTILVQHRDSQSDDDTVLVYFRLGSIKNQQGESRKALNYMEKALEVQPHNREVLASVIELQSAANDWESVIQAKRVMADVAEEEERFALHQEIGGLYRERLENTSKAAEAYHSALDIHPEDIGLLHTLLELYQGNKDWDNVIQIIDRIVELQDSPDIRSKYNYTAAVLMRDEMGAHDEAIDRFNLVLDDDPTMLKAFQAIDSMVTKTKDWKNLERSYRKMLKRLPADGQDQLKLTLW
jgi:tetratricopeptide (TPR) repeat protein